MGGGVAPEPERICAHVSFARRGLRLADWAARSPGTNRTGRPGDLLGIVSAAAICARLGRNLGHRDRAGAEESQNARFSMRYRRARPYVWRPDWAGELSKLAGRNSAEVSSRVAALRFPGDRIRELHPLAASC